MYNVNIKFALICICIFFAYGIVGAMDLEEEYRKEQEQRK